MNQGGPIIIIEDDLDDHMIFKKLFKELNYNNEVVFFVDGEAALKYLIATEHEPFVIFSDINMPKLNGMELRERIRENEELRFKSIPYLFFSTSAEQEHIIEAYSKSVQGFFIKPSNISEIKETLSIIMQYWSRCQSPNYVR